MPMGPNKYKENKVQEFIDEHDHRLRQVIKLAQRDSRGQDETANKSVALAHLCLRWSCNARDVHLLRGLGERVVQEAAFKHDQAIKVACAAIAGRVIIPDEGHLHEVQDTELPRDFNIAYEQICLPFSQGGHGLRAWARYSNAAFAGQWGLTIQSATNMRTGKSHYPVLQQVLQEAEQIRKGAPGEGKLVISLDLANAWLKCIGQISTLPAKKLREVGAWVAMTEGSILNLRNMPEKGQREISQTVTAVHLKQFASDARDPSKGGDEGRYTNWLAEKGKEAGEAWSIVPW